MTTDIYHISPRRPILVGLLGLLVLLALPACGGNLAMTLKAGEFATREKANAEMVVVRLREVEEALQVTDKLLYSTPIDPAAPWISRLNDLNQSMADGYVTVARLEPSYTRGGDRQVLPLKVYTMHLHATLPSDEEAAEMRKREGVFNNFMEAMASLGGSDAGRILEINQVVEGAFAEASMLEEGIKLAEAEMNSPNTSAARRGELQTALTEMRSHRTQLLKDMPYYKSSLTRALGSLANVRVTSTNEIALVRTLMAIASTVVRMDTEAIIASAVVGIHAPQAIPGMPEEVKGLGKTFVKDGFRALKSQYPTQLASLDPDQMARDMDVDVAIDQATLKPRLQIQGGPDLEALKIDRQEALKHMTEAALSFVKEVTTAPERVPNIINLLSEQVQLVTSIGTTLATMSGVQFLTTNPFELKRAGQAATSGL